MPFCRIVSGLYRNETGSIASMLRRDARQSTRHVLLTCETLQRPENVAGINTSMISLSPSLRSSAKPAAFPARAAVKNMRMAVAEVPRRCEAKATYNITLIKPDGTKTTISCADNNYILDEAEVCLSRASYACILIEKMPASACLCSEFDYWSSMERRLFVSTWPRVDGILNGRS